MTSMPAKRGNDSTETAGGWSAPRDRRLSLITFKSDSG